MKELLTVTIWIIATAAFGWIVLVIWILLMIAGIVCGVISEFKKGQLK